MTKRHSYLSFKTLCHLFVMVGMLGAFTLNSIAQTAANTDIKNVASATYSDGTTDYSTVSNEVTVTVAKVAGLTITPDGQTNSSVVAGQTNVPFVFTVTNTGNFTDDVRFLANGGSIRVVGPATVASATVGATDIFTNTAAVLQSLAQNGTATVTVYLNINAGAAANASIQVFLGDAATGTNFDNIVATNSANEVNTVSTGAVNGSREARGDISTTVDTDALPRVTLTAPAGPVTLGSTITYTQTACNDGLRVLNPVTGDSQIYIVSPIPVGTQLTNVAALIAAYPGVQFTTSPLSTAPLSATWAALTTSTPVGTITRIRTPVGATIAAGTCASAVTFDVTITTNNANTPIFEIVDVFGSNSLGTTLTDQSGDNTPAQGDGNANFNEPRPTDTATGTQGVQIQTTLLATGGVLNGTNGFPGAVGPTDNNNDFTNKSVSTGIATVAPGGNSTAAGTVIFNNTLQNTGNADDTYTLTAPTVPTGFTVEISTDGGTTWVTVSGGGNTTVAVAFGASANYQVRVTAPSGTPVLTGYDTVIRATSGIDNTKFNETIDRLYTGFLRLDKSFVVDNQTGVGAATDAVPGADIIYTIRYTNISTVATGNNVGLTATNVVITEDGNATPNNWGGFTSQVVSSAVDYTGATGTTAGSGTVAGDSAGSDVLTDTVPSVAPQAVGRFVFKRKID